MKNKMKVHFIGIGGAGMSGIAKVLLEMGNEVSGSDLKSSRYTIDLEKMGAKISIGHSEKNIMSPDIVVISSAIPDYNVELIFAKKEGYLVLRRAEMLNQISRRKKSIAISGTHGKTTTTSMISFILQNGGNRPTFLIGGELNDIGSNAQYGDGELCIIEADESDGSLVHISPDQIVITNIDVDHLDHYRSFKEIEDLFFNWVSALPDDGRIIVYGDGSNAEKIAEKSKKQFTTFGLKDTNDYYAKDILNDSFESRFTLCSKEKEIGEIRLNVPGVHNVLNALSAVVVCLNEGIEIERIAEGLKKFTGVKRRFQLIGEKGDVTVIDDYAHHPTEVMSTLAAAKGGKWGRVICVFQPHRYSRTKFLKEEFGRSFDFADITIMTDVYSAGEEPIPGVSGKLLVDSILETVPGKSVVYLPNRLDIKDYLSQAVRGGDLVITMGAGDIGMVGSELIASLGSRTLAEESGMSKVEY